MDIPNLDKTYTYKFGRSYEYAMIYMNRNATDLELLDTMPCKYLVIDPWKFEIFVDDNYETIVDASGGDSGIYACSIRIDVPNLEIVQSHLKNCGYINFSC